MLNRKQLEQLTNEELEKIYNDIRRELDEKKAKNRRIRSILSRKIKQKKKSLNNIKNQINEVLEGHPELKICILYEENAIKQDFDDTSQDPKELQNLIQEKQKTLSQLQSKKLHIDRDIAEISKHIMRQKKLEVQLQQDIALMISQPESTSDTDEESELIELNNLLEEIKLAQEEITHITTKIEDISEKIHQKG